jgi:hypothetical protein
MLGLLLVIDHPAAAVNRVLVPAWVELRVTTAAQPPSLVWSL